MCTCCWQGSGKTLAFGLPILQRLTAEQSEFDSAGALKTADQQGRLRGLIFAPTRELALQVGAASYHNVLCVCMSPRQAGVLACTPKAARRA